MTSPPDPLRDTHAHLASLGAVREPLSEEGATIQRNLAIAVLMGRIGELEELQETAQLTEDPIVPADAARLVHWLTEYIKDRITALHAEADEIRESK